MRLERDVDTVLHVHEPQPVDPFRISRVVREHHEALVEPDVDGHLLADPVREVQVLPRAPLGLRLEAVARPLEREPELVAGSAAVGIEVTGLALVAGPRGVQRDALAARANNRDNGNGDSQDGQRSSETTHATLLVVGRGSALRGAAPEWPTREPSNTAVRDETQSRLAPAGKPVNEPVV